MKKVSAIVLVLICSISVFALNAEDLLSCAMLNNSTIRSAREEVTKAQLDVKDAKAGLTPKVDLTVTGSYLFNPIDPIRINLGDYVSDTSFLNGFGNDYINIYEGQESTYYQFSLSATQPLFTWGKLLKAVSLYEDVVQVRQVQLLEETEKVNTEIKTRVAVLNYLNEMASLLDEQKSISSRLVELSDSAFASGMMLETEALGVKVKANQIDVAKAQVLQQIAQMKTALTNLCGVEVDSVEFDENEIVSLEKNLANYSYEDLLAMATSTKTNTFKMLDLLKSVSEKTSKISALSRNWIPDMALVVSANYQGARLPLFEKDWYGKDDWDATLTVALKTTVFDGGTATRSYKKSQSDLTGSEINIDSAKTQVSSALSENYTNIGVYNAQIEYQKALSEQLGAKSDVQKNLWNSGYGSEADYLQVVLEKNNTAMEILQIKINKATALYTIYHLTNI